MEGGAIKKIRHLTKYFHVIRYTGFMTIFSMPLPQIIILSITEVSQKHESITKPQMIVYVV